MKRINKVVITLVLVPVAAFGLMLGLVGFILTRASLANNQVLREYEQEFDTVSHPRQTALVTASRRVLNPPGNGGNCFFFVGEVRSFSGDRSTLEAFYANQPVRIAFFEAQQLDEAFPYELNRLFHQRTFALNATQSLYLVYTLKTRFDTLNGFDLRCG